MEVEVFRLIPQEGHYYETAEATRRTGNWDSLKYLTIHPVRYVGKFLRHERNGYGDGCYVWAFFDLDGTEVRVEYSYEGNTCFREVVKR